MFPSRIMTLWVGLALILATSVALPEYGKGKEQAAPSPAKEAKESVPLDPSAEPGASTGSKQENNEPDVVSPELTLVEKLQARLQRLEEREQQIQDDEQRLGALRQDLKDLATRQEKAIAEAMAIREAEQSTEETDQSQESLNHLIKVYEAMDPEEAALRISKMEESLALDILAGIKDKKAAGMLAGVEPAKAAKLTKGLRHYHKRKRKGTP